MRLLASPLVLLAVFMTGCGSHRAATRLKIEVSDESGARAYRLECGPAKGTAPQPVRICAELRRSPNLLVGGPALERSCSGGDRRLFRVSGAYDHYPVDATFSDGSCGWVPGQRDAWRKWVSLMHHAGPGRAEPELGSPHFTSAQRAHRRALLRRHLVLIHEARRLARRRSEALRAGSLRVRAGLLPDSLARKALAIQLKALGPPLFPPLADARVYSTTLGRAEGAFGAITPDARRLVYVVLVHYAYRDYRRHKHLDTELGTYSLVDARTLRDLGGGGTRTLRFRNFGREMTLSL